MQGLLPLIGAHRNWLAWIALARPAAQTSALLVSFAFGCLTWAFVVSDFSVVYVAQHSNTCCRSSTALPASGAAMRLAVAVGADARLVDVCRQPVLAPIAGSHGGTRASVLGLVTAGFLLFILVTSNPFERLLPAPREGRDLNPLLQDPGLVIHPPLLYMGYVGFSIAYAFAVAALLSGQLDAAWARWSRPWTTTAWVFLTLGIAMGSWWAYYELGWGGWWFWDPVENASFMPWLVGTALVHSLAVTGSAAVSRTGQCCWRSPPSRCRCSAPSSFAPGADLGACVRHRSAPRHLHPRLPRRGDRQLAGAVRLARTEGRPRRALRAGVARIAAAHQQRAAGRRLLVGTAWHALSAADRCARRRQDFGWSHLFRCGLRAADGAGAVPDRCRPVCPLEGCERCRTGAHAALGLRPRRSWWRSSPLHLRRMAATDRLWPADRRLDHLSGALNFIARVQSTRGGRSFVAAALKQPGHFFGMHLAHIGIAVFVIGVTMVRGYQEEKDVKMAPGETVAVAGYEFRFIGVHEVKGRITSLWPVISTYRKTAACCAR